MKILLLGKNGQAGWELQRALAPLGDVVALDRAGAQGLAGDLADLPGLERTVRAVQPQLIVNAAAYTAVDRAESEPGLAHAINSLAPGVLAREAARCNAWLVHYSTDYVFDGSGNAPWKESDPTGPLSVYGHSKLAGEQAIAASGCRHLVFRTSWVYGVRGDNFARAMLRLASERNELSVVADQLGAPTGADLLADVTAHAVRHVLPPMRRNDLALSGIYHVAAAGETSWHGYACFVLQQARRMGWPLKAGPEQVRPISTADYPTAAKRPHNSRLDTTRLQNTFGLHLPHWEAGVARMLSEIH